MKIRNNPNIKGVNIDNENHIISQYADDTSLFITGGTQTLKIVLDIFKKFELESGLKINIDKTQVMPIHFQGDEKNQLKI